MNSIILRVFLILSIVSISSCLTTNLDSDHSSSKTDLHCDINGLTLVAPPKPVNESWATEMININANWVAIIPYAFCPANSTTIKYNSNDMKWQWWGEQPTGVIATIQQAKNQGMKVMLKPQIWFGDTWAGGFNLKTKKRWEAWEQEYTKYLQVMINIADSLNVEIICIGTELKHSFNQRPDYWKKLINDTKSNYSGKVTVAANWDNFDQITFWKDLDYIGIDAYFPLSKNSQPSMDELKRIWLPIKKSIKSLSKQVNKQILFTEYGYRSIEQCTWNNWEKEDKFNYTTCNSCQQTALSAFYETFWGEPWVAGGFLWKWYTNADNSDHKNKDYTPQNKPASTLIRETYKE